ncbi:uncharacterized protein BX663DRAFT_496734 [Cokeromyces recurvatus]|uniref:uncharacterized protein n=1 Tax=Cokeromyces recurvatus TaxID=90255 RepID=UPI002220E5A7|nr:uncharacterized protein BX663DRAFT_496734 [Cokeromyces recurvatus]KAI7906513.1 hypothetical protein BX663DRAFT_496734 [Cokeromyces recurvatus]
MFITISRDSSHLSNFLWSRNDLCVLLQKINDRIYSNLDTTTQVHRITTSCDILNTFSKNGACKDGSCSCTITSKLICLICNILYKTCSQVFKLILENNRFSDCNTVFSDLWRTIRLFN